MNIKILLIPILFSLISLNISYSQSVINSTYSFQWKKEQGSFHLTSADKDNNSTKFSDELMVDRNLSYQVYVASKTVSRKISSKELSPEFLPQYEEELIKYEIKDDKLILTVYPYYQSSADEISLLSDIKLRIREIPPSNMQDDQVRLRGFKQESILKDGNFYKIRIDETGPVKLDKHFFDSHGIDISQVDPRNIQVWGQDAGILPLRVGAERTDDLKQVALYQHGLDDGRFDSGDYILFYGIGPFKDEIQDGFWSVKRGSFTFYNYYFIHLGSSKAKTITQLSKSQTGNERFIDKVRIAISHEEDKTNLLERQAGNSGSGYEWYGEHIGGGKSMDFSYLLSPYELVAGGDIKYKSEFAGRHSTNSTVTISINKYEKRFPISGTKLTDDHASYANLAKISGETQGQEKNSLSISYNAPSNASGWLNYLNINAESTLTNSKTPYHFFIPSTTGEPVTLQASSNTNINQLHLWDVTEPLNIKEYISRGGNENQFILSSVNETDKFLAFGRESDFVNAKFIDKVKPQNLHGIQYADMLIITHGDFIEASEKLAEFRREYNDYIIKVIDVEEIYNEFSSGRESPIGIRDFIKMIYDRSPLQHVLLMGDATFDLRNILKEYPDHNFVPSLYTPNSINYLNSFNYDDFYALLDDDEGLDLYGDVDIGIGRIPVKTAQEAMNVVDKIIHYETSADSYGDWRLRSVFVADDDSGTFMRSSDKMADRLQDHISPFNPIKIHLDAFIQESFADGDRYPEANKTLNNSIHSGSLIVNYVGHGGPSGWAQERVLTIQDINQWSNFDKLPLFITATCTFSAFDNPGFTSGGELLLLKRNGGGIGLFSTTRTVYDNMNVQLTNNIFDVIFKARNGETRQLGDMLSIAKNKMPTGSITNSRKFVLLGDPALELAIPRHNVLATHINTIPMEEFTDTLSALQKVKVEGEIVDENGEIMSNFNGIIIPSLYDKAVMRKTLGQERPSQVFEFKQQENILFKGKSSVTAGKFEFEFIMPKDIDYGVGYGKFSFYAYSPDMLIDAMGLADSILIGGISDENIVDDNPPIIELYLNDTTFVNGDYTNSSPLLIAHLRDEETGINVAGQSIGHDIVAYIDNDVRTSVILNNFYSAELDNAKAGNINYLLSDIPPGEHSLTVEAWDLANNKGSATINFIVTEDDEIMVLDVKAIPNPFSSTSQILIKHNLNGKNLKVNIPIYDAAGRLIMRIEREYENAPATINDIIIDSESFPTLNSNMYFYSVILEHQVFTGEIIRVIDNENKLIHVR